MPADTRDQVGHQLGVGVIVLCSFRAGASSQESADKFCCGFIWKDPKSDEKLVVMISAVIVHLGQNQLIQGPITNAFLILIRYNSLFGHNRTGFLKHSTDVFDAGNPVMKIGPSLLSLNVPFELINLCFLGMGCYKIPT